MNQIDVYPHEVYASVLLDENKEIINWKVSCNYWNEPAESRMTYAMFNKIEKLTTEYMEFQVWNRQEHNEVFTIHAKDWLRNFKISKDYIGCKPYEDEPNSIAEIYKCVPY
ncbi:hypothetical protein [Clostridium gasigenes]|uniref:Uncharacterized protein n=1 Tax=Clostridium gasigenes TaxID=94869 RepID=A0A7X0SH07_9CLOT|nr:hypothetical protein [Clostridium gasigenes]MBB6716227.1 hypothetical protein [Clostridium gasigenes]